MSMPTLSNTVLPVCNVRNTKRNIEKESPTYTLSIRKPTINGASENAKIAITTLIDLPHLPLQ